MRHGSQSVVASELVAAGRFQTGMMGSIRRRGVVTAIAGVIITLLLGAESPSDAETAGMAVGSGLIALGGYNVPWLGLPVCSLIAALLM